MFIHGDCNFGQKRKEEQINNEKIVVHCSTTQYQVLRKSKIIQNKTILCIMLVDQINNEKIVVHCGTTNYQVLRISEILQNKTILCIMLVNEIYNEKSMCV